MKREYDFSKAVRAKFFRKGAELRLPIYLDAEMHRRLERIARRTGKAVGEVVTQLLEKDVELLETLS